jgi:hypothetical protein
MNDDDIVVVFEPDLDLELEVGLDVDIVFTPEDDE